MLLLIAKIAVSAGIVLAVTAAVERLGPRIGGLIAVTPQLAVISLVFFTIEQGPAFAAESAVWNIPGICATIAVYLGYLAATRLVPAPRAASIGAGVVLGSAGFALAVRLFALVSLDLATAMSAAAVICGGIGWLVRRLPDAAIRRPVRASTGLLAVRAGASVVTVLAVTSLAEALGPRWSGLLVGFPVNSLPVMAILHAHYGRAVIKPFIRIFPVGAFGLCLFNLVAALGLEHLGLGLTIVLGYAVDITYLVAVARLSRPRVAPAY
ncbi:MAG TPA: hypothetical protein VLK35_00360 [Methylomirabilota bacterium]|nr:hypothetical protein [Methylomirabilota bacterium]